MPRETDAILRARYLSEAGGDKQRAVELMRADWTARHMAGLDATQRWRFSRVLREMEQEIAAPIG